MAENEKNGNGFSKAGIAVTVFLVGCIFLWAGGTLIELKTTAAVNRVKVETLENKAQDMVPRVEHERRYTSIDERFSRHDERMTRIEQIIYSAVFGVGKRGDAGQIQNGEQSKP